MISPPPIAPEEAAAPVRGSAAGGFQGPGEPVPHLVLKRGHRGRYRFSFRTALGGLAGEVFISPEEGARADHKSEAGRLIAQLALSLLDTLEHQTSSPQR
ncbi:hypothetical protein MKK64_16730 [Methylobacterium sp. E-025]|uniref:hypothetical protein n=1 Tax=Methylobacterium sp. E-025 TaxID=2836561 RepID=UPI001FBA496F|nr:hypothetical protein [Methylobacterium sp. E-025]MCJ2112833.1 hypothetical protein [Methylobacterium sp. E-025]